MKYAICFLENEVKRCWISVLLCFFFGFVAVGQSGKYSWDFSDCELKDILFAVSMDTGISIVPDDTVSGKGDLKFTGYDFDAAFSAFLKSNRLFVERKKDFWVVSRFSFRKEDGLYYLDACDLSPNQILEKISCEINEILSYESLPAGKISVHFNGVGEAELMSGLGKRFGNYSVERLDGGYSFAKKLESKKVEISEGFVKVEWNGDCCSVDVRDGRFSEILEKLFNTRDSNGNYRSYCLLSGGEGKVGRSVFKGEDFNDTLTRICSLNGCSYVCDGGIYYIFADSNKKNELITGERNWKKYSLRFIKTQDFFTLLNKRIGKTEFVSLPDGWNFLCYVSESEAEIIKTLIADVDFPVTYHQVLLKYQKATDFINHLPSSVDKNSVFAGKEESLIYFSGTEDGYQNFLEQVELFDIPEKRISYDLLILQCDESTENNWNTSFSVDRLHSGDRNSVSGMLGSVMGLNLNVVTAFGLTFASKLQNSIEENNTRVFADTTLHGTSGKQISFQNTSTFRYRDNNVDPATGKPIYSGVTREITSGIKLEVVGWVSGDGMITSSVTASVSRQGIDASGSTGNPPPTTEKIVTTEVKGRSGEPLVLSGLVQKAVSDQKKRIPLLSKIPFAGKLFTNEAKTEENSQVIIYLVPHLEGYESCDAEKSFDEIWYENQKSKINDIF